MKCDVLKISNRFSFSKNIRAAARQLLKLHRSRGGKLDSAALFPDLGVLCEEIIDGTSCPRFSPRSHIKYRVPSRKLTDDLLLEASVASSYNSDLRNINFVNIILSERNETI